MGSYECQTTGSDVVIRPEDTQTGARPVGLIFTDITESGTTTLETSVSGPEPPFGFLLSDPPTYYEITTTATFSGLITICIDYNNTSFAGPPEALKLYHYENGAWTDCTDYVDVAHEMIYGTVTSLSPFIIFEPNQPPTAQDDDVLTDEDMAVTIDVLVNDSDVNGDVLIVTGATVPSHGTVMINGDNTTTYTPADDYNGAGSFSYTVNDDNGGTGMAMVTITVNSVNDAPVSTGDLATTYEDTPLMINVLANDSDVDGDPLAVATVTNPANGTAVINFDGTVTYTPDLNFSGTDSFNYTASDGNGGTDEATVTITVYPSSEIIGMVWEDFNSNGEIDFNEKAIENVTIILSGADDLGEVNLITQTDVDGIYMFYDLRPGNYSISEVQPIGFEDGKGSPGTVNDIVTGNDSVDDLFSEVILPEPGSIAKNYNFGERLLWEVKLRLVKLQQLVSGRIKTGRT